jgi:hypothetical protein
MYFEKFPQMLYDFDINGQKQVRLITDVTRNIRFRRDVLSNVTVFDEYDITDGETPEIIAEKLYGNPQYHWIIMLANERFDYRSDFPLPYVELSRYVTDKYGVGNEDDIHHYIDSNGFIVDAQNPEATSVSNRQYEEAENEKKRRIKVVPSNIIDVILKNFKDQI